MESNFEQPTYRPKIKQTPLHEAQPVQALPEKSIRLDLDDDKNSGVSLWLWALGLGVLSILSFSVFHAIQTIDSYFNTYPILSSFLGLGLGAFILAIALLIYKEVKGYLDVSQFVDSKVDLKALETLGDRHSTLNKLQNHASLVSKSSYASRCFRQFESAINSDLSNHEIIGLYQSKVAEPILKKAEEVLKKESFVSGGLAFISPNTLIQTLLFAWISVRTLKRIARVFGLRPGITGNWKLIRVAAENMAAQSFFDLATDEITNQIGSSLAAKFMENSAEAVAAGALNIRLGKALIQLLNEAKHG
ncbi:YcjF family protein [Thiomicrorhabdus arctica]|uniref:YcjF family protein n=1 Tax=Thiomicrorhabdus arctica TaxID=131540 RepID=UPI00035D3DEE|nr:YcjF family protein [Thiomicrorhabdus arctica]